MLDKDYSPINANSLDFTWNENIHWPVLTTDYLENMTGVNLSTIKVGNEKAEIELLKVARLSKLFLFNKLLKDTQRKLEYIVAKDNEMLYEVLEYQVHIFEHGFLNGAWLSMYDDDNNGNPTIGAAAEMFLDGSKLSTARWSIYINQEDIRKDY